jgi:hypothetical protein
VADALDFFTLIYAYQLGCIYLDMGHSRACLDDGLLRYKRKWGAAICKKKIPQGCLLIAPITSCPAVDSFLSNVRLITLDYGQLVCRTVLPAGLNEKKLVDFLKNIWIDGLQRVRLFTYEMVNGEVTREFPWVEFVVIDKKENPLKKYIASVPVPMRVNRSCKLNRVHEIVFENNRLDLTTMSEK